MAKKTKRAPAGHTRTRSAKKTKAKTKATTRKRTMLKQPPLGGMEQARHTKLDKLCESVGDIRETKNALQQNEDADIQAALDYMVKHDVQSYHHHGLEFVLRPGAYKLSVRKHKEITADMGDVDDLGNPEPHDLGESTGDE
jgi:hypothetical protein